MCPDICQKMVSVSRSKGIRRGYAFDTPQTSKIY